MSTVTQVMSTMTSTVRSTVTNTAMSSDEYTYEYGDEYAYPTGAYSDAVMSTVMQYPVQRAAYDLQLGLTQAATE
jgi:hypothetical protein